MTERVDPPQTGSEAVQLFAFLDYQRATLLKKTDGLDAEALNRTLPPSTMTLGGMLKHLALVEDYWCSYICAGNDAARIFAARTSKVSISTSSAAWARPISAPPSRAAPSRSASSASERPVPSSIHGRGCLFLAV